MVGWGSEALLPGPDPGAGTRLASPLTAWCKLALKTLQEPLILDPTASPGFMSDLLRGSCVHDFSELAQVFLLPSLCLECLCTLESLEIQSILQDQDQPPSLTK